MKYVKKPVTIDAVQWFQPGDHPAVRPYQGEGECAVCDRDMFQHGYIQTLEGQMIVCPGDWIITGVKGEQYPCKPDIFQQCYEPKAGEESKE